jgi:hypothetical protein
LRWEANPAHAGLGPFQARVSRDMWSDFIGIHIQYLGHLRTATVIRNGLAETFPEHETASYLAPGWPAALAARLAAEPRATCLFAMLDDLRAELRAYPRALAAPALSTTGTRVLATRSA